MIPEDQYEQLKKEIIEDLHTELSPKQKNRLNSPFVVTMIGGALITLITLLWQSCDSINKRNLDLQQKKYQSLVDFSDKFETALMILNSATACRIRKCLCHKARLKISESDTEYIELKAYEEPIRSLLGEAIKKVGGKSC
jgi:hypothetical protein